MEQNIHVAIACDSNFLLGALNTISTSLSSNRSGTTISFHCIHDLTQREKVLLKDIVISPHTLTFYHIDKATFSKAESMEGNYMSYARLLLCKLLPLNRVIWLDVDVLVYRDLSILWNLNMEEMLVAAALETDGVTLQDDLDDSLIVRLKDKRYFNAGILLLDLDKLREIGFLEASLTWLAANRNLYKYHDQSVINYLLNGQIYELDRNWNFLDRPNFNIDVQKVFHDGGFIYHYITRPKPWQRYDYSFAAEAMYSLMNKSSYWGCLPYSIKVRFFLRKHCYLVIRILVQLRVLKTYWLKTWY